MVKGAGSDCRFWEEHRERRGVELGGVERAPFYSPSTLVMLFMAANIMAEPSGGGTALPIAFMALRDDVGSIQFGGNPIMIAVSSTFKQRTVSPSLVHQIKG